MSYSEQTMQWPCGLSRHDLLGAGNSALVARLDAVIKWVQPDRHHEIERERRVYERLGRHHGILRYHGPTENGVILEYACNNSIRHRYLNAHYQSAFSLSMRLRWVLQVTETIAFIHSKGVLHGDISCNNVFLDQNFDAKVADFAGCSIDGEEPLNCYETSYDDPKNNSVVSVQSEIFALGSMFYEIMTRHKPYRDLSIDEVESAYSRRDFPSVASLEACAHIVQRCWMGGYASMESLLQDVRAEGTSSLTS